MAILKGKKDQIAVKVVAELDGDLGKTIRVPFIAVYKKLTAEEARAVQERLVGGLSDEDLVREHLIEWRDMPGENGETVEFSAEALDEAMTMFGYLRALVNGYMEAQFGKEVLRRKN